MSPSFRLMCIFYFFLSNLVHGQESDSLDFFIKLPIKIDKVYNDFFVDSTELLAINTNNKKCFIEIIDKNLDQRPFDNFPLLSEIEDSLLLNIKESQSQNTIGLLILLTLNKQNELSGFYKTLGQPIKPIGFNSQIQFINIKAITDNKTLEYNILNPTYKHKNDKILGFIKRKELQRFQVTLSTGLHNGISSLKFRMDTSQNITSVYYKVKLVSSFNIKLQATYSVKKFFFGTYICFENNNYEGNTRIVTQKVGNSINLEYSGHGNWPAKLLHLGVVSGYDFLAFDRFLVSPSLNVGIYFYPGSLKTFDKDLSNKTMSKIRKKFSFGGGLYIKIPINTDLLFVSGFFYQFNNFDASNYFSDIKKNSCRSRQELLKLEFGVSIKF